MVATEFEIPLHFKGCFGIDRREGTAWEMDARGGRKVLILVWWFHILNIIEIQITAGTW